MMYENIEVYHPVGWFLLGILMLVMYGLGFMTAIIIFEDRIKGWKKIRNILRR